MKLLALIWSETIGLFLDDEFLAVAILVIVAVAAIMAFWLHLPELITGLTLTAGCVAVLLGSLWRGTGGKHR